MKACRSFSLHWLFGLALLSCLDLADAANNFVTVRLSKGVSVELPKNWTRISNNQRITLDTAAQSITELANVITPPSDLSFAANYFDAHKKTAVIFNVRFYPQQEVTQADLREFSASDIKEIDDAIRVEMVPAMQRLGMQVLSWIGTNKQTINGIVAIVTEYRRASVRRGSPFRVRLVRVFHADRSFTVTISYREDQEFLLRPICDRVIQSIRM